MNTVITASVNRYHDKVAGNFITDWIEKHLDLPSKEKAIKLLKKHIKSEKDLDEVYKALPKIMSFLKSKKAMIDPREDKLFPSGFVKNLAIIIAMISVLGSMYSKEHTVKQLKEHNIIYLDQHGNPTTKPVDKFMGTIKLNKTILKSLQGNHSQETLNKELIDGVSEGGGYAGPKMDELLKVKYPLELKFTKDKAGNQRLYPSGINKMKEGDTLYVHREYTSEKMKQIEDNLKNFKKENI